MEKNKRFSHHISGYEELCPLGCNNVKVIERQPMFQRNNSPPSWMSKNKSSMRSAVCFMMIFCSA